MREKTFKTLDQQINILKEKGLVINDIGFAKKVLFKENYFFLSGYRYLFMTKYKEKKGRRKQWLRQQLFMQA